MTSTGIDGQWEVWDDYRMIERTSSFDDAVRIAKTVTRSYYLYIEEVSTGRRFNVKGEEI